MIDIRKWRVIDEDTREIVAVQITYDDWLEIERLLDIQPEDRQQVESVDDAAPADQSKPGSTTL